MTSIVTLQPAQQKMLVEAVQQADGVGPGMYRFPHLIDTESETVLMAIAESPGEAIGLALGWLATGEAAWA